MLLNQGQWHFHIKNSFFSLLFSRSSYFFLKRNFYDDDTMAFFLWSKCINYRTLLLCKSVYWDIKYTPINIFMANVYCAIFSINSLSTLCFLIYGLFELEDGKVLICLRRYWSKKNSTKYGNLDWVWERIIVKLLP